MSEKSVHDLEGCSQEWLIGRVRILESALLNSLGIDSMKGKRIKIEIKGVKNGYVAEVGTVYDEEADKGTFVFQTKVELQKFLKEKIEAIPDEVQP